MRKYEVRSLDLKEVRISVNERENDGYLVDRLVMFNSGNPVVLYEFETQEEADKARLDWLDAHLGDMSDVYEDLSKYKSVRGVADAHRAPPKPTLTILSAPDGWVAPKLNGFIIIDGHE